MSLIDNLKTEKAKERYDRNYNSVETAFTQKELDFHDREIRNKAIDETIEKIKNWLYENNGLSILDIREINEIAEQLKVGAQ